MSEQLTELSTGRQSTIDYTTYASGRWGPAFRKRASGKRSKAANPQRLDESLATRLSSAYDIRRKKGRVGTVTGSRITMQDPLGTAVAYLKSPRSGHLSVADLCTKTSEGYKASFSHFDVPYRGRVVRFRAKNY